jgi:hypothetical protein
MSVSIGAFTTSKLLAQPYGYQETGTSDGLTARSWRVSGLLTSTEWQSLISVYNTWRDARIQDADSVAANSIGTTVSLTASANGLTWSGISCWFTSAPSGEQAGRYIQASVELVDAAQALQVALRQKEKSKSAEDRPAIGTFTLGGCTLTLLRPPVTYQDVPQMQLTAAGTSYITGPLTATKVYALEGETNAAGWTALQTWFESTVGTTPAAGAYFPLGAPTATAANDVVNGLKVITYTVSLSVGVAQ